MALAVPEDSADFLDFGLAETLGKEVNLFLVDLIEQVSALLGFPISAVAPKPVEVCDN